MFHFHFGVFQDQKVEELEVGSLYTLLLSHSVSLFCSMTSSMFLPVAFL